MTSSFDHDLAYGSPYPESPRSYQSSIAYGSIRGSRSGSVSSETSNTAYGPFDPLQFEPSSTSHFIPINYAFISDEKKLMMHKLFYHLDNLKSEKFYDILTVTGPIEIQIHHARKNRQRHGGNLHDNVGEWHPERRIKLESTHRNVAGDPLRLLGHTVFEAINGSTQASRNMIDDWAKQGYYEQLAEAEGKAPDTLYAEAIEELEFNNSLTHREIIKEAKLKNTAADIFAGSPTELKGYLRLQRHGHTRFHKDHYHTLRPQPFNPCFPVGTSLTPGTFFHDPRAAGINSVGRSPQPSTSNSDASEQENSRRSDNRKHHKGKRHSHQRRYT